MPEGRAIASDHRDSGDAHVSSIARPHRGTSPTRVAPSRRSTRFPPRETETRTPGMQTLRRLALDALWALAAVGIACATVRAATTAGLIKPLVVISGSMEPGIMTGDLLVATKVPAASVQAGDVVSLQGELTDNLVTHRVERIQPDGEGGWTISMKGDNNAFSDALDIRSRATSGCRRRSRAVGGPPSARGDAGGGVAARHRVARSAGAGPADSRTGEGARAPPGGSRYSRRSRRMTPPHGVRIGIATIGSAAVVGGALLGVGSSATAVASASRVRRRA